MTDRQEHMESTDEITEHSIWQSIAFHLLPGLLGGILYFGLVPFVKDQGFPSLAALMLALALGVTPLELLALRHLGRKSGRELFDGLVAYRQRLPIWQYLVWVPIIFISAGLIVTLLEPVTDWLLTLFNWLPDESLLEMGLSDEYSGTALLITYGLLLTFGVLVGPAVEELYFRGYLLPRMPLKLKGWTPIVHSALFALYHTWTPWMFLARTVAVLPLIYIVRHKRNIYLGIIAHCILNSIDFFLGLAFICSHF